MQFHSTRIYAANTADNSISVYDIGDPLAPVEIQNVRLRGAGHSFQLTLDPLGRYLYVVTQRPPPESPPGARHTLQVLRVLPITGKLLQVRRPRVSTPELGAEAARPATNSTYALSP